MLTSSEEIDIKILRNTIENWGKKATSGFGASSAYLFGSLVYKAGALFVRESDVDIVVIFPSDVGSAFARYEWIKSFWHHKFELERDLLTVYPRKDIMPLASIVVCAEAEIQLNIHKDGVNGFFTENIFMDLDTGVVSKGIQKICKEAERTRFLSTVLGFVQRTRNSYLSVSADKRSEMSGYDGADPLPKAAMRAAAMARAQSLATVEIGEEYDTNEGLDYFGHALYELKTKDSRYTELQDLFSRRRNGRGPAGPLSADDQLLVAEIIFDLALSQSKQFIKPAVEVSAAGSIKDAKKLASSSAEIFHNSNVEFMHRFKRAFPGVRTLTWFSDPIDATTRIARLLEMPLSEGGYSPIWWWRDGNMYISNMLKISESEILMDNSEIRISKIAASPGDSYKQSFVYIEVAPSPPTALYLDQDSVKRQIEYFGYADEEFGLFEGKNIITREEYDDGAALIEGVLTDTIGSQLRRRYITPYNFVIAAQASPINNPKYDKRLTQLMNAALVGDPKHIIDTLVEDVRQLPLRE